MTTPQLGPARFHHLAAEYRSLAKTCPTQKEKMELLDLAARYTALAGSALFVRLTSLFLLAKTARLP